MRGSHQLGRLGKLTHAETPFMSNAIQGKPAVDRSRHAGFGTAERDHTSTLNRILVRIARDALQAADLQSIMQGICDCIVAELPVPIASVILLDEGATTFVHEVYAGELDMDPHAIAAGWSVSRGAAGRCVRSGRPLLVVDVDNDPDYVPANTAVRAEYVVPIRHGQRIHGVLNIEAAHASFFDTQACAVFDAIADLVAAAIHFARLAEDLTAANRKLEQMSMSDGLTGIANRRCFNQRMKADWTRMANAGTPLALVLADADAFKLLNDALGHLHGDECLCTLARLCERVVTSDEMLLARFGGEEFVLLLPGHDLAAAVDVARQMHAAVEAARLPHPNSPVSPYVTISLGVAAVIPDVSTPAETLIEMADNALYSAKLAGRNRVEAYQPRS
ncbi:sensor domain-containing diguanylate cyclase [Thermomonas sp.]